MRLPLLALLAAVASTAAAQIPTPSVLTVEAPTPRTGGGYAFRVVGLDDLTGDGRPEIATSSPIETWGVLSSVGRAYVVDATTGATLATLQPPTPAAFMSYGSAVASVGDLDGDGLDEVVVGAARADGELGTAYVYSGAAVAAGGTVSTVLATLNAPTRESGARFGGSAVGLGDIDGDGVPDVVIGAYNDRVGGFASGRAYVYSGATVAAGGTVSAVFAVVESPDATPNGQFAAALADAGDLDHDGVHDLVVGAYQEAGSDGQALVYSGAALDAGGAAVSTTLARLRNPTGENYANFGRTVANAGDVDVDGTPDVAVGAPFADAASGTVVNAGQVVVFSGATVAAGGTVATVLVTAESPAPEGSGEFGEGLASMGDLDGDGRPDLAVGAYREAGAGTGDGAVYVLSGAALAAGGTVTSALATLTSPTPVAGARFGLVLAAPGDLNGDGRPDLAVGAPNETVGTATNAGHAHVFTFPPTVAPSSSLPSVTAPTPQANGRFGNDVVALGDVDGDGRGDVAVYEQESAQNGQVHVVSGGTGTVLYTLSGDDPAGPDQFGAVMDRLGDVDGDGVDDLAIAAHREDRPDGFGGTVQDDGRVYVFSGRTGARLYATEAPVRQQYGYFGFRLVGLGDVDGDGAGDYYHQRFLGEFSPSTGSIYSGADGSEIATLNDATTGQAYSVVVGLGDVDRDGHDDLAVRDVSNDRVAILSGADRSLIRAIDNPTPGNGGLARLMLNASDLDGDGTDDVWIVMTNPLGVFGYSGATGALLTSVTGVQAASSDFDLASVPDLDGDGRPDLVVTEATYNGTAYDVTILAFSGASGRRVREAPVPAGNSLTVVAGVMDLDGDGAGDLVAGRPAEAVDPGAGALVNAGRVYLISGAASAVAPAGSVTETLVLRGEEGWRLIAPPLAGLTYDGLLGPLWTQGFPGADVFPNSPDRANVFTYDETDPGAASDGYVPLAGQTGAAASGVGLFAYVFEDDAPFTSPGVDGGFPKTIPLVGTAVAGPFTWGDGGDAPLSFTSSGVAAADGWNLVGNPFEVAMDWDADGWARSNVASSIYVWDPNHADGAQYRTWTGVAGGLGSGIVPAGSGLWVQATGAAPSMTAPAAARIGLDVPAYARSATASAPTVELRAVAATPRGDRANGAFVVFIAGAADGFDGHDAWELAPHTDTYVSLWTEAVGGLTFDVTALPPGEGTAEVPLGLRVVVDGAEVETTAALSWPALDVPVGWALRLRDARTGAEADLRTAASMEVAAPAAPGDLALVVARSGAVAGDEGAGSVFALDAPRPNPAAGAVTVPFMLDAAGPARLAVYDVLGREVAVLVDGVRSGGVHRVQIAAGTLRPGLYIVRLTAGARILTRRLVVAE